MKKIINTKAAPAAIGPYSQGEMCIRDSYATDSIGTIAPDQTTGRAL